MVKYDEFVRITLRLPPELHGKLLEVKNLQSLNAEIINRLEQSFERPFEADERFEHLQEFSDKLIKNLEETERDSYEAHKKLNETMKELYVLQNTKGLDALKNEIIAEIRKLKDSDD